LITPLLKPHQMKSKSRLPYKIHKDGREVCCKTPAGRAEYRARTLSAWERDKGICGWCLEPVSEQDVTADHIQSRGMGGATRDDRTANLRPCHLDCNGQRGSSPILTRAEWIAWKANKYEPILDSSEIQLVRECGYAYPPEV
jgi:5-methylcytosine-specific restriction endonuclease McrA